VIASPSSRPVIPLPGPLTVPELLDRAFRVYRQHFSAYMRLIWLLALLYLPLQFFAVATGSADGGILSDLFGIAPNYPLLTPQSQEAFLGLSFLTGLVGLVVPFYMMYVGFVCVSFTMTLLTEGYAAHGADHQRARRRFWTFFWASMVAGLVAMVITLPLTFLLSAMGGRSMAIVMLLVIVVAVSYVMARFQAYQPGILEQGWGSTESLRASWELTEGQGLRVLGYYLLLQVLYSVVSLLPLTVMLLFAVAPIPPLISALVLTVLSTALIALWVPVQSAATVMLYYDLRVRKEGIDIERRIDRAAQEPTLHAPVA
jgi:MFS family permease